VSGDSRRSYGLFLGLAEDEGVRPLLIDQLQYLGLIDLQDTVIGRKARNTGHKAIRARAITDLADFIGWERSHGVYYMGVPDLAIGPLYYSLYDAVCVRMNSEFPDGGASLEQTSLEPGSTAHLRAVLTEYGLPVEFDQSEFQLARWISAADRKRLDEFAEANRAGIADDLDGDLVYLARSQFYLDYTRERAPGIVFTDVKDVKAA